MVAKAKNFLFLVYVYTCFCFFDTSIGIHFKLQLSWGSVWYVFFVVLQ